MTEKQYKLEKWTSSSLYYSFPEGNLHHSIGEVIARVENDLNSLYNENEQLKQRNNRQAKQLDRLYNLIEEKDWRALTDILDDFKRCEEQLQKEWGTYGDVE